MTCYQNKYTFKKIGECPHKYDCLFDYIYEHRNETFSRTELLVNSGYVSKKIYEYQIKAKTWSGYMCYVVAALREYGALVYLTDAKKWHIGPYFDYYYDKLKKMRETI